MYRKFHSKVDFLTVYIEEAHTTDGVSFGDENPFEVKAPVTLEERLARAQAWMQNTKTPITSPYVVDLMDNKAQMNYGAFPENIVLLDTEKKLVVSSVGVYAEKLAQIGAILSEKFPSV